MIINNRQLGRTTCLHVKTKILLSYFSHSSLIIAYVLYKEKKGCTTTQVITLKTVTLKKCARECNCRNTSMFTYARISRACDAEGLCYCQCILMTSIQSCIVKNRPNYNLYTIPRITQRHRDHCQQTTTSKPTTTTNPSTPTKTAAMTSRE